MTRIKGITHQLTGSSQPDNQQTDQQQTDHWQRKVSFLQRTRISMSNYYNWSKILIFLYSTLTPDQKFAQTILDRIYWDKPKKENFSPILTHIPFPSPQCCLVSSTNSLEYFLCKKTQHWRWGRGLFGQFCHFLVKIWVCPKYSVQDCLSEKNVRLYLELKVTQHTDMQILNFGPNWLIFYRHNLWMVVQKCCVGKFEKIIFWPFFRP